MLYAEIADDERGIASTRFLNLFGHFIQYGDFFKCTVSDKFTISSVTGLKLKTPEYIEFGVYWIPDGSGNHNKHNNVLFIGDEEFTVLSTDIFAPPANCTTTTVDKDRVFFEFVDFVSDYFPEFNDVYG